VRRHVTFDSQLYKNRSPIDAHDVRHDALQVRGVRLKHGVVDHGLDVQAEGDEVVVLALFVGLGDMMSMQVHLGIRVVVGQVDGAVAVVQGVVHALQKELRGLVAQEPIVDHALDEVIEVLADS
jgi:hypothetical protein